MSTIDSPKLAEDGAIVAAARAGDESAFTALAGRYRRELQVHCYRMLGSFHDSEDLVQETFLKAWRNRDSVQGLSSLRAWLYRIATNSCLDFLASRHRVPSVDANASVAPGLTPPPHIPWLEPYPDRLLEPAAPRDAQPDAVAIARETIELAFLVALQFLPPKQRAVLILADVLEWSAKETGELLGLSVASVNSALQRARATLREHRPAGRPEWRPGLDPDEQQRLLLERYVSATERGDVRAVAEVLADDLRFSMPPDDCVYAGRDVVVTSWVSGGFGSPSFGEFRCAITRVNRMPAVACYVRKPGQSEYRALALDVLRIEDGLVAEIITFALEPFLQGLGLPPTL